MGNYGGGSNRRRALTQEVQLIRMRQRELQARGAFGSSPVEEDISPAEVLYEELRRTVGLVRWMEMKMMEEWPDELLPLSDSSTDDRGSMQVFPTNESAWFKVYQEERGHMARVAKMCIDAGIEQRKVELAERQADLMAGIINAAFDALELTTEQQERIPQIMPRIIRQAALPQDLEANQ